MGNSQLFGNRFLHKMFSHMSFGKCPENMVSWVCLNFQNVLWRLGRSCWSRTMAIIPLRKTDSCVVHSSTRPLAHWDFLEIFLLYSHMGVLRHFPEMLLGSKSYGESCLEQNYGTFAFSRTTPSEKNFRKDVWKQPYGHRALTSLLQVALLPPSGQNA